MLDARAQHLLKTLIERYIAEGQPVGSRTLARSNRENLSAASIRNVMADLSDAGFSRASSAFPINFSCRAFSMAWPMTPRNRSTSSISSTALLEETVSAGNSCR